METLEFCLKGVMEKLEETAPLAQVIEFPRPSFEVLSFTEDTIEKEIERRR